MAKAPLDDSCHLTNPITTYDSPAESKFFSRVIYFLVAAFAVAISLFAYYLHPVETVRTAENDGYVIRTEMISEGRLPKDAYRPLLYPILSAAARLVIGDSFRATQAVSVAAAIALIALTAWLACRLVSNSAAFVATTWTAMNFLIIKHGVLATTDMLFAAFSLAALCCLIKFSEKPTLLTLTLASCTFALAFFTRYTAVFLLIPVAIAILSIKPFSWRRTLAYSASFCSSAALFLVPHFMLTYYAFGVPFYTENWKNVALKIYRHTDLGYVERIPDASSSEFLASSWKMLIVYGFETFQALLTGGLASISAPDLISRTWIYSGFAIVGACSLIIKRNRFMWLLFSYLICYAALISFTFFPMKRLIFMVLPVIYIPASYAMIELPRRFIPQHLHRRFLVIAIAVGLTPFLIDLPLKVTSFWFDHPIDETNAIANLVSKHGDEVTIMGTLVHGWRHVPGRYISLRNAYREEQKDPTIFLESVKQICKREKVDYIVYGRFSILARPPELFDPVDPPNWLTIVESNEYYKIYAVALDQLSEPEASEDQ